MAVHLQADDFSDIVAGVLRHLGRLKIENIAQEDQDYPAYRTWMKKDRVTYQGGRGIQENLYTNVSGNARHVGLLDEDDTNFPDLVKQLQVPWRHANSFWLVEYRTDVLMNTGDATLVDTIDLKRKDAMLSLIEEIEQKAWGDAPTFADELLPWGVKTWIVKDATTGFNGGLPSDHPTMAGVNLTNVPHFKNYAGLYSIVDKADLVTKLRDMHYYIRFMSPITLPEYAGSIKEDYRLYTNRAVGSEIETIGEAQNENLGRDIAPMEVRSAFKTTEGGELLFRGNPIIQVPQLESDTSNPIYSINHRTFKVVCLKGGYMIETRNRAPYQHLVEQYFTDISYNYKCTNRRRNGVLALSA